MSGGDDAVRKVLKEKNPDFDKQLQAHEKEVQQKLEERQRTDSLQKKPQKSGKKTKRKIKNRKIRR